MDQEEAVEVIAQADERERDERAKRLVELGQLLGDETVGFSGQAASWLFEDVKATWLYGYFTASVVTARAFCLRQLAGLMLMLPDEPELPDTIDSLEELAALCDARGLIDLELRATLVALHDAALAYTSVGLHEQDQRLERRLIDGEIIGADDHQLLADARSALGCCVALVHRR